MVNVDVMYISHYMCGCIFVVFFIKTCVAAVLLAGVTVLTHLFCIWTVRCQDFNLPSGVIQTKPDCPELFIV